MPPLPEAPLKRGPAAGYQLVKNPSTAGWALPSVQRDPHLNRMTTETDQNIPAPWAHDLIAAYESGSASQFILYGNVNDKMLVPRAAQTLSLGSLRDYLLNVLMAPFDVVLTYDLGNGIRVEKGGELFSSWPAVKQHPDLPKTPRPAIETLTHYFRYTSNLARLEKKAPHIGCIVEAAELIAPNTQGGYSYDLNALVLLMREWANDSLIAEHAVATFLIVENLNDLHPLLTGNARTVKVKLPLPDSRMLLQELEILQAGRERAIGSYRERLPQLAEQLVGTSLTAVEQLIKTGHHTRGGNQA